MDKNQISIFKLFLAADIGIFRFNNLLEVFKEPENILKASKTELMSIEGIGVKTAESIVNAAHSDDYEREIELAAKNGIDIFLFNDEKYPKPLRDFDDKPIAVYIKGSFLDSDENSISIVGTRKMSAYGKRAAREFSSFFAQNSITVISGLARGIDAQSHQSALEKGGRSIAVLGNGILIDYPPENAALKREISQNGAIISEFPLLRQPDKTTFPRRNRIIAALSKAVLVIEAAKRSGALITARYAAQYGKDVFALPQNIYSPYGEGANFLIQNGAEIALSPGNLLERLSLLSGIEIIKDEEAGNLKLEKDEREILKIIRDCERGIHIDLIADKTGSDISQISDIILSLELKGFIESLPGQFYTALK